jgi:phage major head subunit gpT-like protein
MAGLLSGVAANVVKTALDKVFNSEFDYPSMTGIATAETGDVFIQDKATNSAVVTEQFTGVGYWDSRPELGDVTAGNPKVGNQKTFSVTNYAKSVDISKNLFDDDQHSVVQMMIRNMARNARLTRDKNASSIYANAAGTTLTNDGIALISASHVAGDGTTVSNLVSGALSEATLATGITTLIELKTQDGTLGGNEPSVLLVPPANFKNACIFAKSELRPTTTNNDLNYVSMIYPGLRVLMLPFLGAAYGGSDTIWFLLSRNHSVTRWVRQAVQTNLVDYQYQRNNNYIYKGEFREIVGAITFDGLVGATGT